MMAFENPYIVYVKTNSDGYITAVNSSAFLADTTGWMEIDSGHGDKYHHAQGNYFSKRIFTDGGAYRYRFANGVAEECSAEEIAEQVQDAENSRGVTLEERVKILESGTCEIKNLLSMLLGRSVG